MARKYPPINQIFDDLDKLLDFCKECGFVYNPSDLYNIRTYVWQQYCKTVSYTHLTLPTIYSV